MDSLIQTALFSGQPSLYIIALIFAAGVLTSLTPCVYPMLPITVSIIGSQSKSQRQSIRYSLLYVIGLALVYAVLGVFAARSGQLFGTVASHPITLSVVALFCLAMALWILGWLPLPQIMPSMVIRTRFSTFNVFIAGCLSGLVMAPCTSPVLGMLLMYVAAEGSQLWAALLMFTFAFGMSTLLILAGSFSGLVNLFPASGNWLNISKWCLAALMTGTAVYLSFQVTY